MASIEISPRVIGGTRRKFLFLRQVIPDQVSLRRVDASKGPVTPEPVKHIGSFTLKQMSEEHVQVDWYYRGTIREGANGRFDFQEDHDTGLTRQVHEFHLMAGGPSQLIVNKSARTICNLRFTDLK